MNEDTKELMECLGESTEWLGGLRDSVSELTHIDRMTRAALTHRIERNHKIMKIVGER